MRNFVKHIVIDRDTQEVDIEILETQEANPATPVDIEEAENLVWEYCQTLEQDKVIIVEFLAYLEGESL